MHPYIISHLWLGRTPSGLEYSKIEITSLNKNKNFKVTKMSSNENEITLLVVPLQDTPGFSHLCLNLGELSRACYNSLWS